MNRAARPRIQGLVAAAFTPFRESGEVDLDRIPAYAEHLASRGVVSVFVCGTTGEGPSLTTEERMRVAARWREVAGEHLPVIVQIGHTSIAEAQALARHAQAIGAHATAAPAPYFFKPALAELVAFCAELAGAAPDLPFYYHHLPALTGVHVPVAAFFREAAARIPNLAGAKFTCEDLMDLQNSMRVANGKFEVLFGRDEILLAGLALGCTGAVGSTYNFAAPLYRRILAAFHNGDMETARFEQARAVDMIAVMARHGGLAAAKVMMRFAGVDCGPVRLPLRRLPKSEAARLEEELAAVGFDSMLRG